MSIFSVMGPVMIGPSSSHTAGPVKIGKITGLLFGDEIREISLYFHGSFATTFRGHGTDRALVGGILGYKPDNEQIPDSLNRAREKGIKIDFHTIKLQDAHPNSVLIEVKNQRKKLTIQASSIGGGDILITSINDFPVTISAKRNTLWINHRDEPGKIGQITTLLGNNGINIASMRLSRKKRGTIASSTIELDQEIDENIINQLVEGNGIKRVRYLPRL